jgi:hypothetical protein
LGDELKMMELADPVVVFDKVANSSVEKVGFAFS